MPEYIPPRTSVQEGIVGAAAGKTVLIDNYDSFTYNVVEYLSEQGADLVVFRNDKVTIEEIEALQPVNIVISPGPGHPLHDSGISIAAIKHFAGKIPILGVCMGLQCIYAAYTGSVEFAGEILHGKTSPIAHDGRGLYAGLDPTGVVGTRYHSLAAQLPSLPRELVVTSRTTNGVVMGIRHTRLTVEAVQYHPESILSEGGRQMFANFLAWRGGTWAENPTAGIDEKAIAQAESTKEPVMAMTDAGPASAAGAAAAGGVAGAALGAAASSQLNGGATPKAGVVSNDSTPVASSSSAPAAPASVGTILERIHFQRLKDIAESKAVPGLSSRDLQTAIDMHLAPPQIDFVARLTAHAAQGLPGVMAEMKRASPSKGDIDPNAHAGAQALAYAQGGASVISVLTEPHWFKGTLNDLSLARRAVERLPNRPAILRKDFIVDVYQVLEARLAGADTLLLIVAMLSDAQLRVLYDASVALGMEPLVEVNNPAEMARAIRLGAKVVGVNNRNLHDFVVDMGTTSRLADAARDAGVILCALSGITGRADVEKYVAEGVGAVLVGEALMRAPDKKAFIHGLLGLPAAPTTAAPATPAPPLVKICGLQSVDAAVTATLAGADMLGMILAPDTKRTVTLTQAAEIINVVRSLRGGSESVRTAVAQLTADSAIAAAASASANATGQAAAPQITASLEGQDWFSLHASKLRSHPHRPLIVGVFRDQSLDEVARTATALKLDVVQLHGRTEAVDWPGFLPGVLVIRVFHVGPDAIPGQGDLREVSRSGLHHLAALDTAGATRGADGGTGAAFDWDVAIRVAVEDAAVARVPGAQPRKQPIMIAGGLTPTNVGEAIARVQPFCVDTSSGVETDGRKDTAKIQAFCAAAKQAVTATSS